MFLRRLDIVGFKSFATRTATELLPGIVVVVGPNGSGKSNIADAVLWVLGEQSARAVRARKPEEVIFAGSATRQPLGMAEVSLVLDNADSSLPIEYDEVRVTRRLYRSGDSEYLLNGSKVRLRDITSLLLHAGLSPDSYSVISQGSIDELILQRPDERRVAFENVADIRRHQLRLNDTRNKLTATEANLTRVQDVLAELTPHVKRLKSQADRAQRAETFRSELHDLLVRYFRIRLLRAQDQRARAEAELVSATTAAEAAESASVASEEALKAIDGRVAAVDQRLLDLRPRASELRDGLREAERSRAVIAERVAGLATQRAALEADLARLQTTAQALAADERAAATAAGQTSSGEPDEAELLVTARNASAARSAELHAAQAERRDAQQRLDACQRRSTDAEARLARLEQHVQSLESTVAVDEARQGDREARLAEVRQARAASENSARELETMVVAARERVESAAARRGTAATDLDGVRETLRLASQQTDRLQGALAALGAAHLTRRDDSELSADWQDLLSDLPVLGRARELADRIRPVGALLEGYLRRIVVLANDDAAREAHRRLTTHLKGAPLAWAVMSMGGLLLPAPGEHPLESAPDGHQSVLANWTRQVRDLEAQRSVAEAQRQQAAEGVKMARDAVDDAESDERSARLALGQAEARLAEQRRAHAALVADEARLQNDQVRDARAAAQRTDEREKLFGRVKATREELVEAQSERDRVAEVLGALDAALAERATAANAAQVELTAIEAAAGRREGERLAREALHVRIQREVQANVAAQDAAANKLADLANQAVALREREAALSVELGQAREALGPLDAQMQAADEERRTLQAERQALESQLAAVRAAERSAHEERERRHVAAQRATDEVERLNTEIAETIELEAELGGGVAWAEQLQLGFEDADTAREAFDLDAARRRIATLQRELRAAGGVADSVVNEYREMSDRHQFLENQSADLRAAMTDLRQAAAELETHMRDRFAEAFSAIQTAFAECFVKLFGGGEARLVLTDPDDLLRTGIEIVARPPGKKLQGLVSLSGGERALTVVSLLFGLLRINPTPFCVLDEVDAALDEANVQRFANLLADFAREMHIQFIVVTHNRATMDTADAMYGVSMDGAGVSHVFSVQPRALAESRA